MKNRNKKNILVVSVAAITDGNGKILLTQRFSKDRPHVHLKWQLPGGTVEYNEHPQETLLREIKEEIDLDIQILTTNPIIQAHTFYEDDIHAILIGYPAKAVGGTINVKNDPKTSDAKWFSFHEIDYSLCLPKVQEFVESLQQFLNTMYQ